MNWNTLFAARVAHTKRSAIRELLKVTSRPEVISFGGGLPAAELFPLAQLRAATETVLTREQGRSLQYSETEGIPALREWIADYLNQSLVKNFPGAAPCIGPENILITSGAQQALDLIGRVFLDEGDRVLVENPTYLALLSAWRLYGAEFVGIKSTASESFDLASLESNIRRSPKLIYLVPNFQNPAGTTLSIEQRQSISDLQHRYQIPVVEDNPYGDLRYEGEHLPHLLHLNAIRSDSGGRSAPALTTIYTGTFSKILMPGLRVGWVVAAPEVIDKLVQAKQAADLNTNTFCQHIVLEMVRHGFLDEFVPTLCQAYRERRDAMLTALKKYFPGDVSWNKPEGGMFLMIELPGEMDAREIFPQALEKGVAFVPGEEFHLNGEGKNTLRLNFSNAQPTQIKEGIRRLGAILHSCTLATSG